MKRAKKPKHPVRGKIELSPKQIDKMTSQIAKECTWKVQMINIAYLSERFGWGEDEMVEYFEDVSRFIGYADEGVLKAQDVEEIIKKRTGMTVSYDWEKKY